MVIYKQNAATFIDDVNSNSIADRIQDAFIEQLGWYPAQERRAWINSMQFMESLIRNAQIDPECGILIEYKIPLTSKRVDFLISGIGQDGGRNFMIIEIKQWEKAQSTDMDSVVCTYLGRNIRETTHPSYQAYSYKTFLTDFNENVYKKGLNPFSCAYLHNYDRNEPEPLLSNTYKPYIDDSPLYFKRDADKLQRFIREYVGRGKGMDILYDIQFGTIRPSEKLIDHVCGMFNGNQEFVLLEEQKVAYEKALHTATHTDTKTVFIIKGGPGTGKSVISINLLGALLKEKQNTVFVAPNAAFRDVMQKKLARQNKMSRLKPLFKGSSSFVDTDPHTFDTIIVDEAHRLKSGAAYQYRGDNQLEDIIKAGLITILFIDDHQRIRPEDIGTTFEIKRVAGKLGAEVHEMELHAQFRCAGADGFINWLDHVLHIRQTANYDGWDTGDFEFRICDDPYEVRNAVQHKSNQGYSARMLAGYAWKWTSEKDGNKDAEVEDVCIPEFEFRMPWNSRKSRTTWAIDPDGINQVGCIHTSQGLEFDYVGVLVGNDLRFDREKQQYYVDWTSYYDQTGKKGLRNNPGQLTSLVKNIYKILMTRAMRGCFVYFCDKEIQAHFEKMAPETHVQVRKASELDIEDMLSRIETDVSDELKYSEYLPVYSFAAACGYFGQGEPAEIEGWVRATAIGRIAHNMFVVKAEGSSMEPQIHDGDLCVFRAPVVGTRQNKIVLVQHHSVHDPDYGGTYSIKKYTSQKAYAPDGTWKHEEILLQPLNKQYEPIRIEESESEGFTVIAEFVGCVR